MDSFVIMSIQHERCQQEKGGFARRRMEVGATQAAKMQSKPKLLDPTSHTLKPRLLNLKNSCIRRLRLSRMEGTGL
jgi:hypothetical protein